MSRDIVPRGNNVQVTKYGEWILSSRLGAGAFGTVYLWKNEKTKQEIAIKKCLSLPNNDQAMQRWQTEMKMIEEMCHPNIVSFIAIPNGLKQEYPPQYSLGMEYCCMGDLRKMMAQSKHCCGLPEYHVRDMLGDMGSAINYLHSRHNMHRDLKPENIVLKPRPDANGRYLYKVTDLGYAKDLDQHSCGKSFVGTLHYLAPEFIFSRENLRYYNQVDFWSFGICTFECITGYRPFFNKSEPLQVLANVREKKDEHIFACFDENTGAKRFYGEIPRPHSLNPHFAKNAVHWLRLMLRIDWSRRGGQNDEWFTFLVQEMLPQRYVQVLNTMNMEFLTFPVGGESYLHTLKLQLQHRTGISVTDQLLLLPNGWKPNERKNIFEQLMSDASSLENEMIYLFSTNKDTPQMFTNEVLQEINALGSRSNAVSGFSEKDGKRMLQLCLNCVMTKMRNGLVFLNALTSLNHSVSRFAENLREKLTEFSEKHWKVVGMLQFFSEALEKDVSEYSTQENSSGIFLNQQFVKSCDAMREEAAEWLSNLEDGPTLIREAEMELHRFQEFSSFSKDIGTAKDTLHAIEKNAFQKYEFSRVELRKIQSRVTEGMAQTQRRELETKCQIERRQLLSRFKEEAIANATGTYQSLLQRSKYVQTMRALTNLHAKFSMLLFKVEGKHHQVICIQQNARERQKSRQHSIWLMLQCMKDIYRTADEYREDEDAAQDLYRENDRMGALIDVILQDDDLATIANFDPDPVGACGRPVPTSGQDRSADPQMWGADSGNVSVLRPSSSGVASTSTATEYNGQNGPEVSDPISGPSTSVLDGPTTTCTNLLQPLTPTPVASLDLTNSINANSNNNNDKESSSGSSRLEISG